MHHLSTKIYKFLSKSNVRDYTSPDVLYSAKNIVSDRGEYISEKVYDHIVKELIEYNASDIYEYNGYAEKSDGTIYLLTMYYKKEKANITNKEIQELILKYCL